MAASMLSIDNLRPIRIIFDEDTSDRRHSSHKPSQDRLHYAPPPTQLAGKSLCDQCYVSSALSGYNASSSFYRCDSCKGKSDCISQSSLHPEILYSPGISPIFSSFRYCVSDTLRSNEYYPDLSDQFEYIQNWNIGSCSANKEVTLDNHAELMQGKYTFRGQIISYLDSEIEEYSPRVIWPFNSANEPISDIEGLLYLISNLYKSAYSGPLMAQCSVSNSVGGIIDDLSIPFAPTEMYNIKFTDQDDETVHTQLQSDTTEADDPQKFSVLESVDCDESHKQHMVPSISVERSVCNATVSFRSDEGEDYCGVSSVAQDGGNLSTTVC